MVVLTANGIEENPGTWKREGGETEEGWRIHTRFQNIPSRPQFVHCLMWRKKNENCS